MAAVLLFVLWAYIYQVLSYAIQDRLYGKLGVHLYGFIRVCRALVGVHLFVFLSWLVWQRAFEHPSVIVLACAAAIVPSRAAGPCPQ